MRAPFPWFGGKHRAAAKVWAALGDVDCYVEPFGGSLALLLERPARHARPIETVNDADGLLINWWRAVAAEPAEVARWADWPVSEVDLTARHLWLVERRAEITRRLHADPVWYDAQAAGWWVWGACCWIGSGWCAGDGPWSLVDEHLTRDAGRGIHRQLPHLGDAGRGIHRQSESIEHWFDLISARMRRARVCCGDWRRVLTPVVLERHGTAGVVLDPPYPEGWDVDGAYAAQDGSALELWQEVREEALGLAARGVRVVVCGYRGTWDPPGWTTRGWTARKGYSTTTQHHREVLWCSPACLPEEQPSLFGVRP